MCKLSKKNMLLVIFEIFIGFMLHIFLQINNMDYTEWLLIINILIIISIIQQLLVLNIVYRKFICYPTMFIVFSYVFLLSYQFLLLISYDFGSMSYAIPTNRYGIEIFVWAVNFALEGIHWVFTGILIGNIKVEKQKKTNGKVISDGHLKNYSFILLIIAVATNIGQFFYNQANSVYQGTVEIGNSNTFFSLITYITYSILPAVFLMCVYYKENKQITKIIFVSYIIFEVILMFTGVRAQHFINIILFVYLYYVMIEKINMRKFLKVGCIAVFLLFLMVIIRNGRATGNYIGAISDGIGNVFFNTLSEFGTTINTLCIAKNKIYEHQLGGQFIFSLLAIIPKAGTLFSNFASENNIYEVLDLYRYGSSYITDIYFDFGNYAYLFLVVWGMLIQFVSGKMEKYIKNRQVIKLAYILPFMTRLLFMVRSGIVNLPRAFVWTFAYMVLINIGIRLFEKKHWIRGRGSNG